MATGAKVLMTLDQRRRLIVLEVTACTTVLSKHGLRGFAYVAIRRMAFEAGPICHPLE